MSRTLNVHRLTCRAGKQLSRHLRSLGECSRRVVAHRSLAAVIPRCVAGLRSRRWENIVDGRHFGHGCPFSASAGVELCSPLANLPRLPCVPIYPQRFVLTIDVY